MGCFTLSPPMADYCYHSGRVGMARQERRRAPLTRPARCGRAGPS